MIQDVEIITIGRQAIWVLLKVISPIVLSGMVVGLLISFLQALTQIQEMTLTFIPKILVIFTAILLLAPMIGNILGDFTDTIMEMIKKV